MHIDQFQMNESITCAQGIEGVTQFGKLGHVVLAEEFYLILTKDSDEGVHFHWEMFVFLQYF